MDTEATEEEDVLLLRRRIQHSLNGDDAAEGDDEKGPSALLGQAERHKYLPHIQPSGLPGIERIGSIVVLLRRKHRILIAVGPNWGLLSMTFALLQAATYIFISQIVVGHGWSETQYCASIILWALSTATMLLTALSDPGIVLKKVGEVESEKKGRRWYTFCDICGIDQPASAEHCEDCNVCIEDHDHHCYMLGKCVGWRNLIIFYIFQLCWFSFAIYAIVLIVLGYR